MCSCHFTFEEKGVGLEKFGQQGPHAPVVDSEEKMKFVIKFGVDEKDLLNSRKETSIMVLGQWLLMSRDGRKVYVPRLETKRKRMGYIQR
ncbi:hypothetical protein CR513_57891, partial [Mucuna pruriens]